MIIYLMSYDLILIITFEDTSEDEESMTIVHI